MDFPNGVATNVYKIDDVKEIHWALYCSKPKKEEVKQEVLEGPQNGDERHGTFSLQDVESCLREQGSHVVLDDSRPGLWVFSLTEDEKRKSLQVLIPGDLECPCSGYVRFTDLAFIPGFAVRGAKPTPVAFPSSNHIPGLGGPNQLAVNANNHIPMLDNSRHTASEGIGMSTNDVYPKLLSALSTSMTYLLSKEKYYVQLASDICVDVRTLGDNRYQELELNSYPKKTMKVACNTRWLSTGSLLLSFERKVVATLFSLAHSFRGHRGGNDPRGVTDVTIGDSILLSPFGVVAQYRGIECIRKDHPFYRSRADYQTSISTRLRSRGISVPVDAVWVLVLVEANGQPNRGESSTDSSKGPRAALWPATLCFCKEPKDVKDSNGISVPTEAIPPGADDPLERAQAWFLGKGARQEAHELKQREEAAAARAKEVEEAEEEDELPDLQYNAGQDMTPRDMSGIYPTPPDGIPSTSPNLSVRNEPQSGGIHDNAQTAMGTTTQNERYGNQGNNDDLFGDMDIDMFATNGLTEADFSFFDEPGAVGDFGPDDAGRIWGGDSTSPNEAMKVTSLDLLPFDERAAETHFSDDHTQASLTPSKESPLQDPEHQATEAFEALGYAVEGDSANEGTNGGLEMDVKQEAPDEPLLDLDSLLPYDAPARHSAFDNVPFRPQNSDFDDKYALQGRYGFDLGDHPDESEPKWQAVHVDRVLPLAGALIAKSPSVVDTMEIDDTENNDSSNPSPFSFVDSEEESPSETPQASNRKRKREPAVEDSDQPATPLSPLSSNGNLEVSKTADLDQQPFLLRNDGQTHDFLQLKFSGADVNGEGCVGNDKTFLQIAQMVADQAISGLGDTVDIAQSPLSHSQDSIGFCLDFENTMKRLSSRYKLCTLKDLAELEDQDPVSVLHNQLSLQPKNQKLSHPPRANMVAAQSIFKLPAPYACVQRIRNGIDIAPPALEFWEELSLEPSCGAKNITTFCMYPVERRIQDEVATFLNMMKGAYQSCNLGSHDLGYSSSGQPSGLAPVHMGQCSLSDLSNEAEKDCQRFGIWLGRQKHQKGPTIIYMLNPLNDERGLPMLCRAFLKIFESYSIAVKDSRVDEPNDLVLQVIPSVLVASPDFIPIPSPKQYRRIAFDVYDRCGPTTEKERRRRPQYHCAPAARLAIRIPKSIDFKLTPENSALDLHSDNSIHVAYSWDPETSWLTASWTDMVGIVSWNACYCSRDEKQWSWQSFGKTANEIWGTTLAMSQSRSGPSNILICKDSGIHNLELEIWKRIFASQANSFIVPTLICIDSDPLLDFPAQDFKAHGSEIPPGSLATPDNTPQPNAPSPDISALSSTPGTGAAQVSTPPANSAFMDHDAEARLVDITDETWGVIMTHSTDDLCVPSKYSKFLASGFLVRRAGVRDEDGLIRLAVGLVYGAQPLRPTLKTVLDMYRALGLLARIRGVVDERTGMLPLHVAAARKTRSVVGASMKYGDRTLR